MPMQENGGCETPCYILNMDQFSRNCSALMTPFQRRWNGSVVFAYSYKTNHLPYLVNHAWRNLGWDVETVSAHEYEQASALGVPPARMILNGPDKMSLLDRGALAEGIVNLDSLADVQDLVRIKAEGRLPAGLEIGLRVNFDLEQTCPGSTLYHEDGSRFGICLENGDLKKAAELLRTAGIRADGLHLHLSTVAKSLEVYAAICDAADRAVRECGLDLRFLDLGGGFFGGRVLAGKPNMEEYAETICSRLLKFLDPSRVRLILEPGASVIATAFVYRTAVVRTKDVRNVRYVITDGSLLHINPFLVQRTPAFEVLKKNRAARPLVPHQCICGCTCLENDRFTDLRQEAELCTGDLLEFQYAGAYTMAFNSDFILAEPPVYLRSPSAEEKYIRLSDEERTMRK